MAIYLRLDVQAPQFDQLGQDLVDRESAEPVKELLRAVRHIRRVRMTGHQPRPRYEAPSEGKDHLKGKRIELSGEQKEILRNRIGQLRKNQLVKIKYFTDGYYEELPGRVDSVDAINNELKIYTGVTNAIGTELPAIIPFEDILEMNMN